MRRFEFRQASFTSSRTASGTARPACRRSSCQWSSAPNAGFSPPDVSTWLPVNPNYADGINIAAQTDEQSSLLSFYRSMLHLRKSTPALIGGDYHALHAHSEAYLTFLRHDAVSGQTCLVALNFSSDAQTLIFDLGAQQPRLLFTSHARDALPLALDWLTLAAFEIVIVELV